MGKNNILMWTIAGVLTMAIVGAVSYKLKLSQSQQVIAQAELDPGCNLHNNACTLTLPDGGEVTLSIEPRPIPVIEQLAIKVSTKSINAQAVTVDFSGVDMNMGINRYALKRDGEGSYKGGAVLPVCVRSRMDWEAQVWVQTNAGIVVAPFRFETVNR
jgi:hypothetical protein